MSVGQRRSDPGWSDDIWSVVCGGGGGLSEEVLEGDLLKVRTNKQRRPRPNNWPL